MILKKEERKKGTSICCLKGIKGEEAVREFRPTDQEALNVLLLNVIHYQSHSIGTEGWH